MHILRNLRLEFLFGSTEFTSHCENKLVICLNSNLLCVYTFHWSIYSSISFPRNIGMGVSSASARIGSMSAPYIVWLVRLFMFVHWCCGRPEESAILISRAQLFEGRLALNPWFPFLVFKSILSDNFLCYFKSFQSSICGQKELKLKCFLNFKILIQISH